MWWIIRQRVWFDNPGLTATPAARGATKARQAQSRLKALERLETVLPVHERTAFVFEFEPAEQMPHQLIDLERVDAGYDHAILSNVNFRLAEGARIGLLGRNGVGRSTTIKTIMGEVTPTGSILFRKRSPATPSDDSKYGPRSALYCGKSVGAASHSFA